MRLAKKLFALFFLVLLLASAVPVRASTDPWAYTDWPHRVPITISNNLIDVLTNYQVKITLNSTNFDWSHVKSDGGDIRFTDAQGNPIPYYIEKWDYTNQKATIWVKVPSIPSSGSTTIYMYYGNGAATSESSGDEVFEFFDDFKDYTQNWNINVGSATQESNTEVKAWNGWQTSGLISKMTFNAGVIVEAKVKSPQNGGTGVGLKNTNGGYVAFGVLGSVYSDPRARIITGTTSVTKRATANFSGDVATYHVQGYAFTTDKHFIGLWEGQEVVEWDASGYSSYNGDTFYITLPSYEYSATSGTDYHYYDWVRVRKYAAQEPTVTVGAEETNTKVTVAFYFSDSLGNTLNNVNVYANGTLLGVFNNSNSVELEKGTYTFVFEKDGYNNVTKVVDLQSDTEINVVFVPTNPVTVTFYFKDDLGNTLNNVDLYIDGKFYGTLDSGDSVMLATQGNYTFLAQKQHYISTQQTLNIQEDTIITLTLDRESYLVYFYAYDYNNTEINAFNVYANGTLLGTFSSGGSALVKYGTYVFKFEKAGYRSTTLPPILINRTGITVTFTEIPPSNIYTLAFYFYDASNNSILNNVTVLVNNEQNILNSEDELWLNEGNYTFTFEKQGYKSRNLSLEITNDITMSIYLTPISNETGININQATGMKELIQNITSTMPIEPINPYAKAFLDSGGSFGDTVKEAIKGDNLMKLILPQGLIFIITIIVLWQTQSPLAGLGGALIGQAMFIAMLGEKPNPQNSGVTFVLVVFLIAWTLWDLFYNYSRET